ncbi:MAG: NPCBM/NEW2 domain-containing protein [Armatimonadetes bacterium]|nr:NPCBM/NEW2 domain-containing protein [Armatimonadota bacterium]
MRYLLALVLLILPALGAEPICLGDLEPATATIGWGALGFDRSVEGKPLTLGGRVYEHGLGTHAPSTVEYDLDGCYERFEATVGVDDEMDYFGKSSLVFRVLVDGKLAFDSGLMGTTTEAKAVDVPLRGVRQLRLVVSDGGDNMNGDHGDWADARLTPGTSGSATASTSFDLSSQRVGDGRLALVLGGDGRIAGATLRGSSLGLRGGTTLNGCRDVASTLLRRDGAALVARRTVSSDKGGQTCQVTERFEPTGNSLRWTVELNSPDAPWSTVIDTGIVWPEPERARVWAAWQDPTGAHDGRWRDPLEPQPFATRRMSYGQPRIETGHGGWERGTVATLPLLTVLAPEGGLSLVRSPEDHILDAELGVSRAGSLSFRHDKLRLGQGKTVRLTFDLVAHAAEPRAALAWLRGRYPRFFQPPRPEVHDIAGCAAYSGDERQVDADRLRRMGFRVNWKLSDDFPYMGMFIPPVKDASERWQRANDEPQPPGKPRDTSCQQLNDYARWMRSQGFAVLSYFNVTEFGRKLPAALPAAKRAADDPLLWLESGDWLRFRLPTAAFAPPKLTCYEAYVTDCGDPAYQRHILEQAERHIRLLPDTSGICIDRGDWLKYYNPNADDGISLYEGRPARALVESWKSLMAQLGPTMHRAGRFIFSNPMHPRLDLVGQLDGLYTEFGNQPTVINGLSLLCLDKPLLCWTTDGDALDDAFFQRHLYLGAWPTAPYPSNNHCITPSAERDRWYFDYGPLFDLQRGRHWVLEPGCVSADAAKANLFRLPDGWLAPVVMASAPTVRVKLRGPGLGVAWRAHYPGRADSLPVEAEADGDAVVLTVSTVRGCAVLRGTELPRRATRADDLLR